MSQENDKVEGEAQGEFLGPVEVLQSDLFDDLMSVGCKALGCVIYELGGPWPRAESEEERNRRCDAAGQLLFEVLMNAVRVEMMRRAMQQAVEAETAARERPEVMQ
jgi:hypothetical protein